MRYLMLGAVLLFSTAGVVRADGGLTDAVATAYLVRNIDAELHEIAHARVGEMSAAGELGHDGMRPGTAEVVAWNLGQANPIGNAVSQWIDSPLHNAILSDRSYGRIGCAEAVVGGTHWFACVLAAGPLPAHGGSASGSGAVAGTGPATFMLPDTRMPVGDRATTSARRWFVRR
jgi:hypothetical protein